MYTHTHACTRTHTHMHAHMCTHTHAPPSPPTHTHSHTLTYHRVLKRIGSGHFGTVSKGVWSFCSGASLDIAVKTVRSTSEIERIKLLQEAAIMGQFAHPNVVRLHGVVTVGDPVSV